MAPTIKDVAVKAGVSVGTVSRVIAKNASVKTTLKKRVETAIEELKFRPNFAARALRTNQTDAVGLLVPDVTNPFYARIVKCVEHEATKRSRTVMLANSNDDPDLEAMHLSAMIDRSPKGILVAGITATKGLKIETTIPIISLDRRSGYPCVAMDDHRGSAMLADYLYDLGHRRIAYISGPRELEVSKTRIDGFAGQLNERSHGLGSIDLVIEEGRFDYRSAEEISRRLLAGSEHERPTAIACASDKMAIGALRTAQELGIAVPDALTVVGFDDIDLASLVVPRLTTVRQPVDLIAEIAMQMISGENEIIPEQLISGKLIVRASSAAISAANLVR